MSNPFTSLEALLCNACRRALGLGLSFTNQIRLYRSIIALTREVRLRSGSGLFEAGNDTLAAPLAAVCDRASELGLPSQLPLPDAILVQRLVVRLSSAARLAGDAKLSDRKNAAQHPIHHETDADDDRLSPWRNDHTTDRDQRAHELLLTVIDERVIAKIKAMNRRDREEWAAAEQAGAA